MKASNNFLSILSLVFLLAIVTLTSCQERQEKKPDPVNEETEESGQQAVNQRTFRFVNSLSDTIWVGALGKPLPDGGGWVMPPGDTTNLILPDTLKSARFWARTDCKIVNGTLTCATGDCVGKGVKCGGIGGESPATLAEVTLGGTTGTDFYDISLVDGYNIGMKIIPFGNFQKVNNPGLNPKFNCGSPTTRVFDFTKCPDELQLKDANGNIIGCMSVCAAVNKKTQVQAHPILANYDKAQVCCSCDCGEDCGCKDPRCKFGCSPLNNDPSEVGGKCFVEQWPRASNGMRYDSVFKAQSPDAYSWQFDDHSSTYQCVSADYEILFFDR